MALTGFTVPQTVLTERKMRIIPFEETLLYGMGTVVVSGSLLIVAGICIVGFSASRALIAFPSYRIILLMLFSDFVQLIIHFTSGILSILETDPPRVINRCLGCLLSSSYLMNLTLLTLLLINRFCMIIIPKLDRLFFNGFVFWIILLIFCFPFFGGILLFIFTDVMYSFDHSLMKFTYPVGEDFQYSSSFIYYQSGNVLLAINAIVAVIVHTIMFTKLYILRGHLDYHQRSVNIQIFFISLFFLTCFVYWTFIEPAHLMSNFPIIYFGNLIYILYNGFNSIIYLLFNRTLWISLRFFWKGQRKSITVSPFPNS